MPEFSTATNILNDAAVELGLEARNDPFDAIDANFIMLVRLLKGVGRGLVRARDWTHLTREYTFPTVASTPSYALPTGFNRMKDLTHWNRDTAWPLGGPVNGRQWQMMKATTSAGVVIRPFRVFGNLLYLYPTPTAAEDIYYEYVTNFWVMPSGQTVPTTSEPTATTDTLWFDEPLLRAGLKLAWKNAKGFPSQAERDEYDAAWSAAAGADGAAPALNLGGNTGARLIDNDNLPESGFGS